MSSSALQDIVDGGFLAGRVVAVDVLDGAGSSKGEPVWGDANDRLLHQFIVKTLCVKEFVLAAHFPVVAYTRDTRQEIFPGILTQAIFIVEVM